MRALDNGGRFYNLWEKVGDDIVDSGEQAKAAGVVTSDSKAFLYFKMALMDLPREKREDVLALLSPDLKLRMNNSRTSVLNSSAVEVKGTAGNAAIVTGYPVFVEDKTGKEHGLFLEAMFYTPLE